MAEPASRRELPALLDWQRMEATDARAFQATRPYPWLNPRGLLHEEGYRALAAELPDVLRFEKHFGTERKHGQRPHDRYYLAWRPGLALSPTWQAFIEQLHSTRYRRWVQRMVGTRFVSLHFHWLYAPLGAETSPHCDSKLKLGSHIFYLNTHDDWRPEWGGETLVLDDGGRLSRDSAPEFEDFAAAYAATTLENYSLLFTRRGDSWHGVRAVQCPEGHMRKVFVAVIEDGAPWRRVKRWAKGRSK
jgi:hypothetical protein